MARLRTLILAHARDDFALRVYWTLLQRYDADSVKIVSDEELVFARRWCHSIAEGGDVRTEIELTGGERLDSAEIGVVLNCLRTVERGHFVHLQAADAQYARMETSALWLSWLAGMRNPVINRPSPRGLSGASRGEAEWLQLASAAGLPIRGWQISTNARRFAHSSYAARPALAAASSGGPPEEALSARVPGRAPALFLEPVEKTTCVSTVVGNRAFGTPAGWWQPELLALAELADVELMQALFALRAGGSPHAKKDWRLCHVSPGVSGADGEVILAVARLLDDSASASDT